MQDWHQVEKAPLDWSELAKWLFHYETLKPATFHSSRFFFFTFFVRFPEGSFLSLHPSFVTDFERGSFF